MEKYEEGTPAHNLYIKRIEEDMALQAKHYTAQLNALSNRQTQIIDGFLASKERIIEQTGQITTGILDTIQKQTLELGTYKTLDVEKSENALPNIERLALESSVEKSQLPTT